MQVTPHTSGWKRFLNVNPMDDDVTKENTDTTAQNADIGLKGEWVDGKTSATKGKAQCLQ